MLYTVNQCACMHACTARTSVLTILQKVFDYYKCMTICNFMNAVMKRIHVVGTDT